MYESYYGLTERPFQSNPDPSFYFGSRQHRRAMAYLEYGVHRAEGFIVITGEVGAGKTTLVRSLLAKLDTGRFLTAHLVSTQLDANNALRVVASAFGVVVPTHDKADLLVALETFFVNAYRSGKRCLLIVDEAQNLSTQAVEELRMLSNFQVDTQAVLQSFLVGQPEFRYTLQSRQMTQLRQRVIAACHIGPMDQAEIQAYVEHRLRRSGWTNSPSFAPSVFQAAFERSGGIPRRINAIFDRLLLSGYLSNTTTFDESDVAEVATEIEDEVQMPKLSRNSAGVGVANVPGTSVTEGGVLLARNDDLLQGELRQRLTELEARLIRMEGLMDGLVKHHERTAVVLDQLLERKPGQAAGTDP